MAKMRAIEAAIHVLEREGITATFGVPGAAINPFYAAMRKRNSIRHILARHVEGASHMAEGYTRARAGNIGVCVGTSGPAGTAVVERFNSLARAFLNQGGSSAICASCERPPREASVPASPQPPRYRRAHRSAGR
jgi:glyoxylate carboligase